ncbi:MAG: acyl-CoA dehydrogenase family protein [Alphaproteobacteria bacterium]|nr:acyl-CoA dehydrogenase family protein [Alphaproteobacteria bacterium]
MGLTIEKPEWMTEDLQIFEDAAIKFTEKELLPHIDTWEEEGRIPREVWRKAGDAGLLCPQVPEEYGGAGGNFAHDAVLIDVWGKLGAGGFGASLHNAIVAPYILAYGTEEQKKRWLPRMATGELIGAIAMTEPGTGSDLQSVKTTAKKDGNCYVINGAKTFITNGGTANFVIVVAKTDPTQGAKGISLVCVETDEVEGFRRGRKLDKIGLHSQDTSELFFEDVKVPAANLLGEGEGRGFFSLMEALPSERLQIALQGIAMIERAIDETVKYTRERKAFGKAVMDFQNTQFVLADCKAKAIVARVFCNWAVGQLMAGKLDAYTASMAKMWVTDEQCKIVDACLQLHGGYGYMNEYPIARMYRDARVQKIYGGTNEIMKVLIARSL